MHEIAPDKVRQHGVGRLRWFSDESHDLYVWQSEFGRLLRFQFCYDKGTPQEQVVRWRRGGSVEHALVDDGERLLRKQSPIFMSNGTWDPRDPLVRLRANRKALDPSLYRQLNQVFKKLRKSMDKDTG